MPYLFLAVSVLAGATKGYCGKRTSGRITGWHNAIEANLLRMLLCILIGFGFVAASGQWSLLLPTWKQLGVYALSGISTSVFVVTWLIAVRTSAYVLMNVFLMLGVIVPMVLGNLCYGEAILWNHWLGLAVLLAATLLLCSYNNGIKSKLSGKALLILTISGLANGVTSFAQKMNKLELQIENPAVFNFYTYIFSALSLALVLLLYRRPAAERGQKSPIPSVWGYLVVMAISLFLNSFFLTMANSIPSSILYPLERGVSMILSGLMAAFLFKEKITLKAMIGLILAFLGLLITKLL